MRRLALSDINPFDAREAKAYQEEKEITAMRQLRLAYDANDLARFESTLRDRRSKILDDPFIMSYVDPLRRRMREQVLLALVKPYQRVKLAFIAKELSLKSAEVEALLVDMILDERIQGKIDQMEAHLVLTDPKDLNERKRYEALATWSDSLNALSTNFAARIQ